VREGEKAQSTSEKSGTSDKKISTGEGGRTKTMNPVGAQKRGTAGRRRAEVFYVASTEILACEYKGWLNILLSKAHRTRKKTATSTEGEPHLSAATNGEAP